MSRILRFERRAGPSERGAVTPRPEAQAGTVSPLPRANVRQIAKDWAEDCIRAGLARVKDRPGGGDREA